MNQIKKDLTKASQLIGLTESQSENLWKTLQEVQANNPRKNFFSTLLYFGAIIVLLPMTWLFISHLTHGQSLFMSITYALIFFGTGSYFWYTKKLKVPGGMLVSLGIAIVPLIIYSFQNLIHWWGASSPSDYKNFYSWIQGDWVPMEIGTLLIACLTLYFIRFPFITVLIYFMILFISMDATHALTGSESYFTHYSVVSIIIGSLLNLLGFGLNRKNLPDFGFWSYLFGMLLLCSGLGVKSVRTEWGYFIYFLIHFGFLLVSHFFHRTIFVLFGSLGVISYIGHLSYIFSDSLLFSYILSAIGFLIILLATFLNLKKNRSRKTIE